MSAIGQHLRDSSLYRRRYALLLSLLVVTSILLVHWRALFCFFSADDLVHLQQAAQLLPTPHQPWRILTQVLYFRMMLALFGPSPQFFMLVNIALHCTNALLLYRLLVTNYLPAASSALSTILFAACPLLTIAIGHAVIITDISAMTLSLLTLTMLARNTRSSVPIACALFVVALLCKESVLFFPLISALPTGNTMTAGQRLRRLAPILVIIAGTAWLFFLARSLGAAPNGGAYAFSLCAVVPNLLTYTAWFVSIWNPLPDLVRSSDTHVWLHAIPFAIAVVLTAVLSARSRSQLQFAAGWLLLGLLPVLPLKNSAYPHYLYVALPGLAALTAVAMHTIWERLARGSKNPEQAWRICASLLACAYVLQAQALVSKRFTLRVEGIDLPLDPQIRSMVVAGRAAYSLTSLPPLQHAKLAILSNVGRVVVLGARTGRQYAVPANTNAGYDLERVTLNNGRALRVFYPQLDSVLYTEDWSRALNGFFIAVPYGNGDLRLYGPSPDEHLRLLRELAASSAPPDSARYADSVRVFTMDATMGTR